MPPAALGLVLLTGCLSHTQYRGDTSEIRISPAIALSTRTAAGGDGSGDASFPHERTFRLWAVTSGSGRMYIDGEAAYYDGASAWRPEGGEHWPSGGSLLLYGFCPDSLTVTCSTDGTLRMQGFDASQSDSDLLYSVASQPYSDEDGVAGMPFRHALAQIDFRVRQALGADADVQVHSISISGAQTCGDFDSSLPLCWECTGGSRELAFFDGTAAVPDLAPVYVGDGMPVIPQEAVCTISVSYSTMGAAGVRLYGQTAATSAFAASWSPGRRYTYTIILRPDGLTCSTAIGSWAQER